MNADVILDEVFVTKARQDLENLRERIDIHLDSREFDKIQPLQDLVNEIELLLREYT